VSAGLDERKVLEVGCGRGLTLLEFAKRGATVTGVDYARSAVSFCNSLKEEACKNGNDKRISAEFLYGDARSLPFGNEEFDIVYSVGLLEHFQEPSAILAEQCRVLKPGGVVIVQVPQKYSAYTILKKVLMALGRWPYGAWELQYSERELRTLVLKTGLSPKFSYGYGSFSLALLRHFLFPALDYGIGGWHRSGGGFVAKMKANTSLDVGIVASKDGMDLGGALTLE
jgi:ubiquinone/menaquinone biosynthesis C-methylase UbiE